MVRQDPRPALLSLWLLAGLLLCRPAGRTTTTLAGLGARSAHAEMIVAHCLSAANQSKLFVVFLFRFFFLGNATPHPAGVSIYRQTIEPRKCVSVRATAAARDKVFSPPFAGRSAVFLNIPTSPSLPSSPASALEIAHFPLLSSTRVACSHPGARKQPLFASSLQCSGLAGWPGGVVGAASA